MAGVPSFSSAIIDQLNNNKGTETTIRSHLRSPTVTVRRAQSIPSKQIAATTSSSSTATNRKSGLHQQLDNNNSSSNKPRNTSSTANNGESSSKAETHQPAVQTTLITSRRPTLQQAQLQMRTIEIEPEEPEGNNNAIEGEKKDRQNANMTEASKPIVFTGRRKPSTESKTAKNISATAKDVAAPSADQNANAAFCSDGKTESAKYF